MVVCVSARLAVDALTRVCLRVGICYARASARISFCHGGRVVSCGGLFLASPPISSLLGSQSSAPRYFCVWVYPTLILYVGGFMGGFHPAPLFEFLSSLLTVASFSSNAYFSRLFHDWIFRPCQIPLWHNRDWFASSNFKIAQAVASSDAVKPALTMSWALCVFRRV